MPIHDRIGRALSKGVGALGGFVGDIFGGVVEAAPTIIAQRLGGLVTRGGAPTSIPIGINPDPAAQASLAAMFRALSGGRVFADTPRGGAGVPLLPGVQVGRPPEFPTFQQPQPFPLFSGGETPMGLPVAALPGGAPVQAAGLGGFGAGLAGGLLGEGIFQGLFGNGGNGPVTTQGVPCPTLFVPTRQAMRAVTMFRITNPATGADVWYRNAGRPLLWSGDFAAVKRVRKVAGKAHRRSKR